MVEWIEPPTWTPGDSITATKENIYSNDLIYIKEILDALGLTGPLSAQGMYDHNGVYWEAQHFLPEGFLETVVDGAGWIEWYTHRLKFGPGLNGSGSVQIYKDVKMSPTCRPTWEVKRQLAVVMRTLGILNNLTWIISGQFSDVHIYHNTGPHVGFKLVPGGLYASTGNGANYTELKLMDAGDLTEYVLLEVKLIEGKAYFYVNSEQKGIIDTTIPTGSVGAGNAVAITLASAEVMGTEAELLAIRFLLAGSQYKPWETPP